MNQKDKTKSANVLSFGRLEDFAAEVHPAPGEPLRVEGVIRTTPTKGGPGPWLKYVVAVTTRLANGDVAACVIEVGGCWELFRKEESHHYDNLGRALELTKDYLVAQGHPVGTGIWNPSDVLDNGLNANTGLWTFRDKKLVPREEVESEAGS